MLLKKLVKSKLELAQTLDQIVILFCCSRGAFISKPHSSTCVCTSCSRRHGHNQGVGEGPDSLRQSLIRINTYKALASPAWLCLTTQDPIHAAFKLSWELSCLARKENEFKKIYLSLSGMCLAHVEKPILIYSKHKIYLQCLQLIYINVGIYLHLHGSVIHIINKLSIFNHFG